TTRERLSPDRAGAERRLPRSAQSCDDVSYGLQSVSKRAVAALCVWPVGSTMKSRSLTKTELESLRDELEKRTAELGTARWNAEPDEVQRSVVKLVLTLVEFLRQLMEKQAIRRIENGTLTSEETENIGLAIMRIEETIHDLAARFDLSPEDLNINLGPLG